MISNNILIIIFLLIFIFSILLLINNIYSKNKYEDYNIVLHKCVISNKYYPEINNIIKNIDVLKKELYEIIKNQTWTIWGNSYNSKLLEMTPRFSDLSTQDKLDYLEKDKKKLGNNNSWKLFGLILEKKLLENNIKYCPETYNIIKNIPGLINAGFSCLEPFSKTPFHNDKDERFYRIHIPIIIPNDHEKIGLDIFDEDNNKVTLHWKTDYFVFDDTCFHQAFNNTNQHRIILLLDIERRI